jgi:hypothetical protein
MEGKDNILVRFWSNHKQSVTMKHQKEKGVLMYQENKDASVIL